MVLPAVLAAHTDPTPELAGVMDQWDAGELTVDDFNRLKQAWLERLPAPAPAPVQQAMARGS